ncbi:MAG: hypothetical protein L6R38_000680 [Xanthoria sp. 2 TBL-2021]|nr:MAG: hypothetical protein L6R38_000680 [Xanthoria sp. 2 TBL-2021]
MTCALIYVVVVPKRRREKANTAWEANLLSKLPIELRLKIYRHLLVTQDDTKDPGSLVRRMNRFDAHFRKPPDFDATILRACRQVYTEALPILYGENIFECSALEGLQGRWTMGKMLMLLDWGPKEQWYAFLDEQSDIPEMEMPFPALECLGLDFADLKVEDTKSIATAPIAKKFRTTAGFQHLSIRV